MAHQHNVYDTDKHFVIDPNTRKIENQSKSKVTLIQNDHDSERFTFQIPRYVEEHDMSICNKVEVHYLNIENGTNQTQEGIYEVTDLQVSPDSEDVVICSWLISRNATKYIGTLHFALRFACLTDEVVDYDWRTGIYSEFPISETIFNTEAIVEEYADILADWEARITALEEGGGTDLSQYALKTDIPEVPENVSAFTNDAGYLTEVPESVTSWEDLEDKPFYEETSETVILEKEVRNTEFLGPAEGAKEGYDDGNGNLASSALVIGDTYVLTFDGVDYIGVAEWVEDTSSEGNNGVQLDFYAEGQSESFAGLSSYSNVMHWAFTEDKTYSPAVTFSVKHVASTVKTLDPKYLPDTVALKTDIPDTSSFLTAVPDEYVTEDELTAKGYLTEHQDLSEYAKSADIPTDDHINSLINTALGVIENGTY